MNEQVCIQRETGIRGTQQSMPRTEEILHQI